MNIYEENLAEVRAMSMLMSRFLGSCRCLGTGNCGMHRIKPYISSPQGHKTWTVDTCTAALREAGTQRSDDEAVAWAEETLRHIRPAEEPVGQLAAGAGR